MRGASLPKTDAKAEKQFLHDVHALCETHQQGSGSAELEDWGGWFRNRFREDPDKARRVLADIASLARERKLAKGPGAAFYDLWQRLPTQG